jgi:hypothetical protein
LPTKQWVRSKVGRDEDAPECTRAQRGGEGDADVGREEKRPTQSSGGTKCYDHQIRVNSWIVSRTDQSTVFSRRVGTGRHGAIHIDTE